MVFFSDRAISSIFVEAEYYKAINVETGGVLLGHIDENGNYYVLENVLPGFAAKQTDVSFEYDEGFVNYQATSLSNIYEVPLDIVGLWHCHLEGIPVFSTPDRIVNKKFADSLACEVISGIAVFDSNGRFEMKVYKVDNGGKEAVVSCKFGDLYIPDIYRSYVGVLL